MVENKNLEIMDLKDTLYEVLKELRTLEKPTDTQMKIINSIKFHIGQMGF